MNLAVFSLSSLDVMIKILDIVSLDVFHVSEEAIKKLK